MTAAINVNPQSVIYKRLVVSSPGFMNAFFKPIQDILIDPDGNPCLAKGRSKNRASFSIAEIKLGFHRSS
jgi:hypothetical protein